MPEHPVPASFGHDTMEVSLTVNGYVVSVVTDVRVSLADVLRRDLKLTGTHLGCEHGSCGACTVIVDGKAVRSCLMLAVQADGCAVETVEGLSDSDALGPLQQAFADNHAVQCGFCTSGFLMSLTARLREGPLTSEAQAREALSGNICRCTGYVGLVDALLSLPAEAVGGAK